MTVIWRKQLLKAADVFASIPFDENVCAKHNFEPLILAIILPFFSRPPWLFNSAKVVRECEGNLQRIWSDKILLGGNLLHKLFPISRSLESVSGDMVREVL